MNNGSSYDAQRAVRIDIELKTHIALEAFMSS